MAGPTTSNPRDAGGRRVRVVVRVKILVERERERVEKVYLFAHYESRGGASLVVARNHLDAVSTYLTAFDAEGLRVYVSEGEGEDAARAAVDNLVDAAQDDFVARYELRVCDAPLPEGDDELLEEYRDDGGYRFGVVERRYFRADLSARASKTTHGRWSKWSDSTVAVLWQGARIPTVTLAGRGLLEEELRLLRRDVGEDAYGLVLVRAFAIL